MPLFSKTCDCTKLKSNLRLCVNRMGLLQKKKTEMNMKSRREIAELLKQGKIERSRIKTEQIVREDYVVEVLEILQTYCELLLARFGIFESSKEVDAGLEEAISTIIWCCPRLSAQVNELRTIRELFAGKYSKEYVDVCTENKLKKVSPIVIQKLDIIQPPASLVEMYMMEIAKTYGVDYEPNLDLLNNTNDGYGGGGSGGGCTRTTEQQLIDFEPGVLPSMPQAPQDFTPEGGHSEKAWDYSGVPGPGAPYPGQSPFPGPAELPPPNGTSGGTLFAVPVGYYGYQPAPPTYDSTMFPEKPSATPGAPSQPPLPEVGPVDQTKSSSGLDTQNKDVPAATDSDSSDDNDDDNQDFDELQKRFQQLTKK